MIRIHASFPGKNLNPHLILPLLKNRTAGLWMAAFSCALLLSAGCSSNPTAGGAAPAGGNRPGPAGSSGAASLSSTNTVAQAPKSEFHTDVRFGRDPFFPGSSREVAQVQDAKALPLLPLVSYLKLAGIRTGTKRPMALINQTPFAPGEEGKVAIVVSNQLSQAEVHKLNVRCLEIRQDSVLISIAGEPGVKELRIAQGR